MPRTPKQQTSPDSPTQEGQAAADERSCLDAISTAELLAQTNFVRSLGWRGALALQASGVTGKKLVDDLISTHGGPECIDVHYRHRPEASFWEPRISGMLRTASRWPACRRLRLSATLDVTGRDASSACACILLPLANAKDAHQQPLRLRHVTSLELHVDLAVQGPTPLVCDPWGATSLTPHLLSALAALCPNLEALALTGNAWGADPARGRMSDRKAAAIDTSVTWLEDRRELWPRLRALTLTADAWQACRGALGRLQRITHLTVCDETQYMLSELPFDGQLGLLGLPPALERLTLQRGTLVVEGRPTRLRPGLRLPVLELRSTRMHLTGAPAAEAGSYHAGPQLTRPLSLDWDMGGGRMALHGPADSGGCTPLAALAPLLQAASCLEVAVGEAADVAVAEEAAGGPGAPPPAWRKVPLSLAVAGVVDMAAAAPGAESAEERQARERLERARTEHRCSVGQHEAAARGARAAERAAAAAGRGMPAEEADRLLQEARAAAQLVVEARRRAAAAAAEAREAAAALAALRLARAGGAEAGPAHEQGQKDRPISPEMAAEGAVELLVKVVEGGAVEEAPAPALPVHLPVRLQLETLRCPAASNTWLGLLTRLGGRVGRLELELAVGDGASTLRAAGAEAGAGAVRQAGASCMAGAAAEVEEEFGPLDEAGLALEALRIPLLTQLASLATLPAEQLPQRAVLCQGACVGVGPGGELAKAVLHAVRLLLEASLPDWPRLRGRVVAGVAREG